MTAAERVKSIKDRMTIWRNNDEPLLTQINAHESASRDTLEFVATMAPIDIYTAQRMARAILEA